MQNIILNQQFYDNKYDIKKNMGVHQRNTM